MTMEKPLKRKPTDSKRIGNLERDANTNEAWLTVASMLIARLLAKCPPEEVEGWLDAASSSDLLSTPSHVDALEAIGTMVKLCREH